MTLTRTTGRPSSCLIIAALFMLATAPTAFAQASTLRVFIDQSKAVQIKNLKRVSVTNPRVADVVIVSPYELIVNGLQQGRTTMYLWDDKGRKEVQLIVMKDRADIPRLIRQDVKKIVGVDTIDVKLIQQERKETLILRGVVETDTQIQVIEELAKAYFSGNIINLLEAKAEFISVEDQLKRMIDLPEVKVTVLYKGRRVIKRGELPEVNSIILEGFVDDQRDYERVEAIAKSFGNIINLIEVVNPIQVLIEGHILEMSKNKSDKIGMTWGTAWDTEMSAESGTISWGDPTPNSMRFFENLFWGNHGEVRVLGARVDSENAYPWEFENLNRIDPLYSRLDFQLTRGTAKLLAAPKVITRIQSDATIRVGGSIPVPGETDAGGTTIQYKQYGIEMKVTPDVDHKGNITTDIEVTWTTVDRANAYKIGDNTYVALRERSTKNEVTVRDGQHIIISGLLQKEEGKVLSGIPLLHKIPVLGNLFKSTEFANNQSELVIIVTPSLLASKRMREKFSNFDKDWNKSLEEVSKQKAPPVASLAEMSQEQAEQLRMAAAEVDRTFAKILSSDEPTITPVNLPTFKLPLKQSGSSIELAAGGGAAGSRPGKVASRALAGPAASSGRSGFVDKVRRRLRRGRISPAAGKASAARRARLERQIRARVRASRNIPDEPVAEASCLFPQEHSSQPLEQRLKSIITELPDDDSLSSATSSSADSVPAPPARARSQQADINSDDRSETIRVNGDNEIDSRVDQLFLQIKEKLSAQ